MYQPRSYPAVLEQLRVIAHKKGLSVERWVDLYLQMAASWEALMERETAIELLEGVLTRCIEDAAIDL